MQLTGNGNYVNLLELAWKNFMKSHRVNLILEGFIHLKPQCACFMRCSFLDIPQAEFFRQSLRIALFLQEKAF